MTYSDFPRQKKAPRTCQGAFFMYHTYFLIIYNVFKIIKYKNIKDIKREQAY